MINFKIETRKILVSVCFDDGHPQFRFSNMHISVKIMNTI